VSSYLDESIQDLAADLPDTILSLRGRGLMRGIQIAGSAAAIREAAHTKGLLVATAGDDVIRLLPPLVIETQHVDVAITALREVLS
jgi:acetylornithine/N-succinyldiaminopimelate aminotransferase